VGTEACTVFAEIGGKVTCDAAELATLIADVGYGVRPDSEAEGAQLQLDVDHVCVLPRSLSPMPLAFRAKRCARSLFEFLVTLVTEPFLKQS
jgi:hypothetical protein